MSFQKVSFVMCHAGKIDLFGACQIYIHETNLFDRAFYPILVAGDGTGKATG